MRWVLLAIFVLLAQTSANSALPARLPPIEYSDELIDRPPLDAALKLLYRRCGLLADAGHMMQKVLLEWATSFDGAMPMVPFGWHNYVRVTFFADDPAMLFDIYGPRGMSSSWAQPSVEYFLGAGDRPGIAPRDLLAFRLCGAPATRDGFIALPDLSFLSAPPSDP